MSSLCLLCCHLTLLECVCHIMSLIVGICDQFFNIALLAEAVTMQAQRVAPPDLQCKDKFLIQGIVVPFGTSDEDITSDMVEYWLWPFFFGSVTFFFFKYCVFIFSHFAVCKRFR